VFTGDSAAESNPGLWSVDGQAGSNLSRPDSRHYIRLADHPIIKSSNFMDASADQQATIRRLVRLEGWNVFPGLCNPFALQEVCRPPLATLGRAHEIGAQQLLQRLSGYKS
jgi:hypothetical protein